MKGIIFNLVEAVVSETHGERVWDQLLTDAGLDGGYTSIGDYPDRPRVFERFFRTHQAADAELPGAGLGLSLVESIVQAHGGTVSVESEPGRGTRFRVVLPTSDD